jgi:hypothetical protein
MLTLRRSGRDSNAHRLIPAIAATLKFHCNQSVVESCRTEPVNPEQAATQAAINCQFTSGKKTSLKFPGRRDFDVSNRLHSAKTPAIRCGQSRKARLKVPMVRNSSGKRNSSGSSNVAVGEAGSSVRNSSTSPSNEELVCRPKVDGLKYRCTPSSASPVMVHVTSHHGGARSVPSIVVSVAVMNTKSPPQAIVASPQLLSRREASSPQASTAILVSGKLRTALVCWSVQSRTNNPDSTASPHELTRKAAGPNALAIRVWSIRARSELNIHWPSSSQHSPLKSPSRSNLSGLKCRKMT